jgi:class 3 adenylate cyclase
MVEGLREREQIRETFGRYVDESVASTILRRQGEGTLAGETGEATILFTDIAGFTTIAEYLAPHELVAALNEYLETVLGPIRAHGGVVNTFIGDCSPPLYAAGVPGPCLRCGSHRHPAGGGDRTRRFGVAFASRIAWHRQRDRRLGRRRPAPDLPCWARSTAARLAQLNGDRHASRLDSTRQPAATSSSLPAGVLRCAVAAMPPSSSASTPRPGTEIMNAFTVTRPAWATGARSRAGGAQTKQAAEVDRAEHIRTMSSSQRLLLMPIPQRTAQGERLDAARHRALSPAPSPPHRGEPTWARSRP